MMECTDDADKQKLPLSFCASIFGMKTKEFNGGFMSLREEFTYMCKSNPQYPKHTNTSKSQSPSQSYIQVSYSPSPLPH